MATKIKFAEEKIDTLQRSGNILIHLLPNKLPSYRYQKFIANSLKKNLPLKQKFSKDVTHIVSELDTIDEVLHRLCIVGSEAKDFIKNKYFLKTQWLSDCLKCASVVEVTEEHKLALHLNTSTELQTCAPSEGEKIMPEWACMRSSPLNHKNHIFTDALEVLEKQADFVNDEQNYSRALAFRRCIATLKSYPKTIKTLKEVKDLPHVGEHCQNIIKDILEYGSSHEVEKILESDFINKMKVFTGVFGVGPATAKRWIQELGLITVDEAITHSSISVTQDQRIIHGLAYYEDLNLSVKRCEAEAIHSLVAQEISYILPDASVVLTGGFRRGKDNGHDIDLLISHPEEGKEVGLLSRLLKRLEKQGLLLYGKYDHRTDTAERLKHTPRGQYLKSSHDEFEKWYGIVKLDKKYRDEEKVATKFEGKSACETQVTCQINLESGTEILSTGGENSDNAHHVKGCAEELTLTQTDCIIVEDIGSSKTKSCTSLQKPENSKLPTPLCSVTVPSHKQINCIGPFGTKHQSSVKLERQEYGSFEELEDSSKVPAKRKKTENMLSLAKTVEVARKNRSWFARRVDLVIAPASQYYYALVGWTGSKFFNRDLRLYAQKKLSMKLSSHALWDGKIGQFLSADSERKVFENLKLEYKEPWERNA